MPASPAPSDAGSSAGPERDDDAAVVATGLTRAYGDHQAVAGVDLEVRRGEIFGFIGPSGSGKTTAVRLLTGIERPDDGTVRVLGKDPASFSADERADLGYMPQLSVLFPSLSLWQNLSFVASIYGMPLRRRRTLRRTLDLVELREHRRKRLRDTSGGMQRRLALAAALVHDPPLLFLDEPTAGIDPVLRRRFWDHFIRLRDRGRTLFVTTQYVTEASYCDRVAVLRAGRVLTVDTPDGLRRQAYGGELLDVETRDPLPGGVVDELLRLPGVQDVRAVDRGRRAHRLTVDDADARLLAVRDRLEDRGVAIEGVREHLPSFDDVFVSLVQGEGDGGSGATAASVAGLDR